MEKWEVEAMSTEQQYAYILYWLACRPGVYLALQEVANGVTLPDDFVDHVLNDLAAINAIDVNVSSEGVYHAFVGADKR